MTSAAAAFPKAPGRPASSAFVRPAGRAARSGMASQPLALGSRFRRGQRREQRGPRRGHEDRRSRDDGGRRLDRRFARHDAPAAASARPERGRARPKSRASAFRSRSRARRLPMPSRGVVGFARPGRSRPEQCCRAALGRARRCARGGRARGASQGEDSAATVACKSLVGSTRPRRSPPPHAIPMPYGEECQPPPWAPRSKPGPKP